MEKQLDFLIIDDDSVSARLTEMLLGTAGFKCHRLEDSADALLVARKKKPRAVIIDLMLDNLNGLELVKLINSDPQTGDAKIIVVTQKSYDFEKKQAFKYGVSGFIKKPYDVETFAKQVEYIISGEKIPELPKETGYTEQVKPVRSSLLEEGQVRITLWGHRGLPAQFSNMSSRIGRQTPCVSLETKDELIILDAGSGIVPLGNSIVQNGGPREIWLLITHFHLGHIWGLANFMPAYKKGYKLKIAGPDQSGGKFEEILNDIFYGTHFWECETPKSELMMYAMGFEEYDLSDNIKVTPMNANHSSNVLCYKLDVFGKKIIYAPDSEIAGEAKAVESYDEKLEAFCKDADVLIHDTAYTHDDYLLNTGKGHSSDKNVLEFAAKAGVKNLLMFHFDGRYSDEIIETIIKKARKTIKEQNITISCPEVKEGFSLVI